MAPLAGVPLVALAVVVLAATTWAALTTDRRVAWFSTAALLWAGAVCFAILALAGAEPFALVVLGWALVVAGLLTASRAVAGRLLTPLDPEYPLRRRTHDNVRTSAFQPSLEMTGAASTGEPDMSA